MTTPKLCAWLLLALAIGLLIGLYWNELPDPFPRTYKRRTRPQRKPGQGVGNVSPWDKPIPVRRTG